VPHGSSRGRRLALIFHRYSWLALSASWPRCDRVIARLGAMVIVHGSDM
jgi:hypothetical protein